MAAAAIPVSLVSHLVAQTGQQVPCSHVDDESGVGGIPLVVDVDLNKLNPYSPERRRKVVEAIGRSCESDDGFFMPTNHGVPASPAGVVEGMLRVDGDLFRFHLPESESEQLKQCYSDDPNKAAEATALLAVRLLVAISESLGLDLERSHLGRYAQPHMAVSYYYYYPSCPQPELTTYGLPGHKDPSSITLLLLQDQEDGVSSLQVVQRGGRWVAVKPVTNALVINIGDLLQAIRLSSTSFNIHPHCYPLESFVDHRPSNPPSSFRVVCDVLGENICRAIQLWVHKLGCPSTSYCLPITVNDPSPYGSGIASPFSPLFIQEKNDVEVEDISKFALAAIAGTLSLLVPVAINIDELTTTWAPLWKVLCGIFMIMSLMSALIGLFTSSFRAGSRARNLSSHCARMSLVGSTIVFMLLIASKLGCLGCATGITLVVVMLVLTVLWIRNEEPGKATHEV